jgi:hypothetical protein
VPPLRSIPIRPPRRSFRTTPGLLVALVLAVFAFDVAAQNKPKVSPKQMKAEYLCRYPRYVEWPDGVFPAARSPIVIGVLGEDPFGTMLDRVVVKHTVDKRRFELVRLGPLPPVGAEVTPERRLEPRIKRCHVLFICESERARLPEIRAMVRRSPILTISDTESFARKGGMIELVLDERKGTIVFEINARAAKEAGLKVDLGLLDAAKSVHTRVP